MIKSIDKYRLASMLLLFFLSAQTAFAFSWPDLWWRADEQGQQLLAQGKAKAAADKFEDPHWQAVANFRAGNYKRAAEDFLLQNSAVADYNRANSLAHLGQYEEAIQSYDKSLAVDSTNEDARYNKKILETLLKQQKKSQKNQSSKNKQSQNNKTKRSKPQKADTNKSKKKPKKNKQPAKSQAENPEKAQKHAQKQAAKQWLRRIPDAPSGLLRQKFLRDYLRAR